MFTYIYLYILGHIYVCMTQDDIERYIKTYSYFNQPHRNHICNLVVICIYNLAYVYILTVIYNVHTDPYFNPEVSEILIRPVSEV